MVLASRDCSATLGPLFRAEYGQTPEWIDPDRPNRELQEFRSDHQSVEAVESRHLRYREAVRVLGLIVDIRSGGRPACTGALIESVGGTQNFVDHFELTSQDTDLATLLADLGSSVKTRVRSLEPVDRAVVRRADLPPRPTNAEGPRLRLLAEGAVISAVRSLVGDVRVGSGRDLGAWTGTSKDAVDAEGEHLSQTIVPAPRNSRLQHIAAATAAAIAGTN